MTTPLISAVLSLVLAAPLAAPPPLPDHERQRLENGEIIIHGRVPADDIGLAVTGYALVDAPPASVWPHIRDCGRYDEFMPRVVKSELRGGTADEGLCFVEISVPFPLSNLWAVNDTKCRSLATGGYERSWKLKEGTYRKNRGRWRVTPWGDGQRTLIYYELEAAPDTMVPDRLLRSAQKDTLPDVFKAVRARTQAAMSP